MKRDRMCYTIACAVWNWLFSMWASLKAKKHKSHVFTECLIRLPPLMWRILDEQRNKCANRRRIMLWHNTERLLFCVKCPLIVNWPLAIQRVPFLISVSRQVLLIANIPARIMCVLGWVRCHWIHARYMSISFSAAIEPPDSMYWKWIIEHLDRGHGHSHNLAHMR